MSDYIKREDVLTTLINILPDLFEYDSSGSLVSENKLIEKCIVAVNNIPTADVQEVRHGKWEQYLERYYRCSVCLSSGYTRRNNFCPKCGAKMDLED